MSACWAGLQISQAVQLQVGDIDSHRVVIRIRRSRRNKDRYSILSPALLKMLRHYCRAARPATYLLAGRRGKPVSAANSHRTETFIPAEGAILEMQATRLECA